MFRVEIRLTFGLSLKHLVDNKTTFWTHHSLEKGRPSAPWSRRDRRRVHGGDIFHIKAVG